MKLRIKSVAIALGLLSAVPSGADWAAGESAFLRSDYAGALRELTPLAEQGHLHAQFLLGVMHAEGYGVAVDGAEAAKWYRLAAEQGNASAQNRLGFMHARGEGVAKDDVEAMKWYRRSAMQGNAWAQYNLGRMYAAGEGAAKDEVVAYHWQILAAAQELKLAKEHKRVLERRLSAAQINEAKQLARAFTPKPERGE